MPTATWNRYEAHDEMRAGQFDIDRVILAIDCTVDDDFELGEPWDGGADTLDDDPE